jgi:transposase
VPNPIPSDIEALRAALAAEQQARREAEARASGAEAMVAHLKLLIAKMKRDRFGASAERGRKLLDQLEMQLEELETAATEDEVAADTASDETTVRPFTRAKPVRGPLPAHLPRERVVLPSPTACPCCGGKLAKFGEHQPLNRQSERFALEGIDLSVSTLADWVGACASALSPLVALIAAHVLAAERLHGDDTTVPVLARGKTITGRLWVYVRDDLPFGGRAPPGAIFHYSPDRGGKHPCQHLKGYAGILQADAYAGFNDLYHEGRKPGPIIEAACWAHGRRKLFVLADLAKAP